MCTRMADTTPRTQAAKFRHSEQQICHQNFHYAQRRIGYCKDVDVIAPTTTEGQIIILRKSRMDHKNNKQNCHRSKSRSKGNNKFDIKNKVSDLRRRNA